MLKLPWDKKYIKIAFHVIVTVIIMYMAILVFGNIIVVKDTFFSILKWILLVLRPILIAFIVAYVLDPLVDVFEELWKKIKPPKNTGSRFKERKLGTASVYIIIFLLLIFLAWIAVEKIGSMDINYIADKINDYVLEFNDFIVLLKIKLAGLSVFEMMEGFLQSWINIFTAFVTSFIYGIADSITGAGAFALSAVIGITAAFYFLVEKEKILYYCKDILYTFFSSRYADKIYGFFKDTDEIFSNYLGGQLLDAAIMAVLISFSFTVTGIKYAVIIGIVSGLSNLVPYLGAFVAFALSVSVGFISGTAYKALIAAIIIIVLQQLDSIVIVPKVVGKSVKLHPVMVLLSLSVFGGLFGISGMFFAVPVTVLLKLFAVRLYENKKTH